MTRQRLLKQEAQREDKKHYPKTKEIIKECIKFNLYVREDAIKKSRMKRLDNLAISNPLKVYH
jgi:hypothetical protein